MLKPDRRLYTSRQCRQLDRIAMEEFGFCGLELMKTAGRRAFSRITGQFGYREPFVVLCGAGNNGGDGYVVARCALETGLDVRVVQAFVPKTPGTVQTCQEYLDLGGTVASGNRGEILHGAGLIVDGLFGTGLSRAPAGASAELISAANRVRCPVAALDIPSGLDSDTGAAFSPCIRADMTVTFIGKKLGLYTGAGTERCGPVCLEDLGVPAAAHDRLSAAGRMMAPPRLPGRRADSHKRDYGSVVVAGGNDGMLGAALLCGQAALRCGSGLVTVLSTRNHLDMPAMYCPELMSRCLEDALELDASLHRCDAVVLGPGLGQGKWSESVFERVLSLGRPTVIDADGLNILSRSGMKNENQVLTPHPGEAARLLQCTPREIQNDRAEAAREITRQYGGVCILKGAGSLVADGPGEVTVCDRGNPGMASAGMGDVLSGIVGAWVGQGMPLPDAACAGVWLHSACADQVAENLGETSLLASDVVNGLPGILVQSCRQR